MWRFKAADKGLIGVDIGVSTVKLIEFRFKGVEPQVSGLAMAPLRMGAVIENRIHDDGAVADALSHALAAAKPLGKRACVAVPAGAAIVKTLSLPASLGEDDIESRLQLESDKHIPFPFDDITFDFQSLGALDDADDQQAVLLVACRRQTVEQRVELLRRVGLTSVAVDVDTFAVERAMAVPGIRFSPSGEDGEGVALVDIGTDSSTLYILQRGRVVYRHDIALGGRVLIEATRGRHGTEHRQDDTLAPCVDALARQVGRAMQLYHAAGRGREIRRMALAGSVSLLPGLAGRLAGESGLQVAVTNPLHGVRWHPRVDARALAEAAPDMLIARGLAMRGRS
ncbi:type IV pilus assembly protein PilM [Halomonas eurihalina]|uniref:Type IV pilus assembly protein PilM n=1 Tax=Halomonas eurihalina TaxID=42566 RepID=A0A5D9D9R0_HALER|nr:type IV pilus assembly protein PilM [Halomonas eurihalina]MDR5858988.1 type IV pilus assembly protein PilM [Halomonas eurihalina]TZG39491.1 type IV pilus assembly protein PilM [Halomonas eurihalina]